MHAGIRIAVNIPGLDVEQVGRGMAGAPELPDRRAPLDAWVTVLPGARPRAPATRCGCTTARPSTWRASPRSGPRDPSRRGGGGGRAAGRRRARGAARPVHRRALSPVDGGRRRGPARGRPALARTRAARRLPGGVASRRRRVALRELAADRGEAGMTLTTSRPPASGLARPASRWRRRKRPPELEALPPASGTAARWFGSGARPRCARHCSPAPRSVRQRARNGRSAARPSWRRWCRPCRPRMPATCCGPGRRRRAGRRRRRLRPRRRRRSRRRAGGAGRGDLRALGAEPFAPPTLASLAEELRRPPRELGQILEVLARRGEVVRVDKDLWFAARRWTTRGACC